MQGLVALKVQYHTSCYRQYTKHRQSNLENIDKTSKPDPQIYAEIFDIVREKVTNKQETVHMAAIRTPFKDLLHEQDVDVSYYI